MIQSFVKCFNPYFNSIKVQLEHRLKDSVFDLSVFQFHKGTIRTYQQPDVAILHQYFNSIKVQLERRAAQQGGGRK